MWHHQQLLWRAKLGKMQIYVGHLSYNVISWNWIKNWRISLKNYQELLQCGCKSSKFDSSFSRKANLIQEAKFYRNCLQCLFASRTSLAVQWTTERLGSFFNFCMINLAFDCRHNLKPNCTWNSLSGLTVSYVVSLYKDFLCCFALLWFKEQFGSLQKRLAATFFMCLSKASKMVTRYILRLQQNLLLKIKNSVIAAPSIINSYLF